jgi:hypothetical protein
MTTRTPAIAGLLSRPAAARVIVALLAAIVAAVAVNTLVATLAIAWGATPGFAPLTLPVYGGFTLVGIVVGWFGWRAVERRARNPRRVLAWLVPFVGLVSFVPDVALAVFGFIPGTTGQAVAALMTMHVVVIAAAVPAYLIASRRSA